jgi:hypothetical protein
MRYSGHIVAACGIATLAISPVQAQGARCFADWSEAAPIVRREQLVPVDRLTDLSRGRLPGEVVKATLCVENTQFVYRIVVREPNGQIRIHTVNARKPFDR